MDDETSWQKQAGASTSTASSSPDAFLLLLRRAGDLIGYALVAVEPDGDVLWSDTWQVGDKVAGARDRLRRPEERGHGLGSLLLDVVDAELEARGIHDLAVGAVPGNTAALRLYERRGFLPDVDDRHPVRSANLTGGRRQVSPSRSSSSPARSSRARSS